MTGNTVQFPQPVQYGENMELENTTMPSKTHMLH